MFRRAQGLSLQTIIIAILVLLVLVIVGAIFGRQIGIFGKETRAMDPCPGEVRFATEDCSAGASTIYGRFKDVGMNQQCCATPEQLASARQAP